MKKSSTGMFMDRAGINTNILVLQDFLKRLESEPETIAFADTMAVIESHYDYTATAFSNGEQHNKAGENEGSCKILAFAYINNLSITQTLHCFGDYYRKDVLDYPSREDHQNIRQFILDGFEGIKFDVLPLQFKG